MGSGPVFAWLIHTDIAIFDPYTFLKTMMNVHAPSWLSPTLAWDTLLLFLWTLWRPGNFGNVYEKDILSIYQNIFFNQLLQANVSHAKVQDSL